MIPASGLTNVAFHPRRLRYTMERGVQVPKLSNRMGRLTMGCRHTRNWQSQPDIQLLNAGHGRKAEWGAHTYLAADHSLEDINWRPFPRNSISFHIISSFILSHQNIDRDCFKGLLIKSIVYLPASFGITDTMMRTISLASVLLPLSAYAVAVPATAQQSFPEVKPGPGLPSLASLNLTSAQLYQG